LKNLQELKKQIKASASRTTMFQAHPSKSEILLTQHNALTRYFQQQKYPIPLRHSWIFKHGNQHKMFDSTCYGPITSAFKQEDMVVNSTQWHWWVLLVTKIPDLQFLKMKENRRPLKLHSRYGKCKDEDSRSPLSLSWLNLTQTTHRYYQLNITRLIRYIWQGKYPN
jgi:hypothetical protein